jgi:hypothetical protein
MCSIKVYLWKLKYISSTLHAPIEGIFNSEKLKTKNAGLCFAILEFNACCNSVARQIAQCMSVCIITFKVPPRTGCQNLLKWLKREYLLSLWPVFLNPLNFTCT